MSHSTSPDGNNALVRDAPPSASAKSPSTKPVEHAPVSSPPFLNKPAQNHVLPTAETNAMDVDNDSEAETLISSPVKKRELLKQAAMSPHLNSLHEEDEENAESMKEVAKGTQVKAPAEGHVNSNGRRDQQIQEKDTQATRKDQSGDGHNQNSDSDNLSEVSSVNSFDIDDDQGNQNGHNDINDDNEDNDDDARSWASDKDEDRPTNPRKRKHPDVDQPRRRRKTSDHGLDHSSSPQLRRHRRTASAQSVRPSQSRSNSGQHTAGVARQRRAATHMHVRDAKLTRSVWDSDTSSETSHRHPKNRLTRNTSRAVSTPGRPMGRDHKRHVNKYGFTRLAEACENGELDSVKEWRDKDPEQLEQREFAGNTPLQVASLNGYPEIVSYLIEQGCNPHCANADKDTPLIDAVENGHVEVVHILLKAGVNPLRQNLRGQQALDVVTDETDNSAEIRTALRESIEHWVQTGKNDQPPEEEPAFRPGPTKGLQFLARTYDNLLKLVSENDRTAVQEFLDARVPVDNAVVAAAAKTGDLYLVNMLLAEMTPKKAKQRAERPMLAVLGTSHFEMVKALTELDQFDPLWRSRTGDLTWFEMAENRQGPNWREEMTLLKKLFDAKKAAKNRLSSSPVHRRETNKKRQRSMDRDEDSDVDMDGTSSPERARSRRRLVSKKDMRTASRQGSTSAESDVAPPRRYSGRKNSVDRNTLKPPGPRKVGRPRKHSNSHLSEPQPKRRRESSSSQPDRSRALVDEDARQNPQEDIKVEEVDQEALDKENARKAEVAAKEETERLADEQRKAEETRKQEEASRRKEAERKAEEIRRKHEQQQAENRRLETEKKLQAFPSALAHILGLSDSQRREKETSIQRHFLPIQAVKRADLGATLDGEGRDDELWMLNYQAAAILTGTNAALLLDLPIDAKAKQSSLAGLPQHKVTEEQRRLMLACFQSTSLVHSDDDSASDKVPDNLLAELAEAERIRLQIQEDRAKFMDMSALRWVRFSDFYNVATSSECPHSAGLSLDMRFDCCLDPIPFGTDVSYHKSANGTDEDKTQVNGTNGTHDKDLSAAGPGITTITVVQD